MLGLVGFIWRSKAAVLTPFCSSPVRRARLSVKVSAMRNSMSMSLCPRGYGSSESIFPLPINEGRLCSFKNLHDSGLDLGGLNGTGDISKLIVGLVAASANDLLGIADHCQIRIVRDHDYLAALLRRLATGNENLVNGLVVEVLLRLIDNQRYVVLIHQEIEDQ